MTRKDYQAIADAIQRTRQQIRECITSEEERQSMQNAIDLNAVELSNLFHLHNERFDSKRFLAAAGNKID